MENKNIPEIRFSGFSGDWEQRKLGDIADFAKGHGYSKSDLTDEGKPIILYGRLYTKYETVIESVDTFTTEKEKSVISRGDEVIVPSSGESAEEISRASVVNKPGIILGGDLNIIRTLNEIEPAFLALTISNGKQQKELSKRAQGKSVVHLHNSDLKEVNLLYPKKEEQTKVSNFFKQLDDTISLHQKEIIILKQTKQGFLQKMFPKEGESLPEVRFPGFTGDWEERRLDTILKERKVKQKISKELPLLAFAAGQGVIDRSERKTNNRDFLTKDSTKKTYLLTKYDDIVYNPANLKYGAIDRNKHGQGVISPIYVTFETDEIPSFIELIVKSEKFKQQALQYEEGTVTKRQSVKPENLLCLNVVLPNSKVEQTKIGNFFKQIDDTIALHQHELDNLKETKKAFLQKMFV